LLVGIAVVRPGTTELVVDFLVPACVASRYRARLASLSPIEAELRFAFCPSIFRSGAVESCPAEISLALGAIIVRLRGRFSVQREDKTTIGHLRFAEPAEAADLETLRRACQIDGTERRERAAEPEAAEVADGSVEESEREFARYPAFLQSAAV
jgi:hypothetical protein